MYEKIKDMIERNDFHTAERMLNKYQITLSAHETKSLIHLMEQAKKALQSKARKAKSNRFIESFWYKLEGVVFNISMFFFGCWIVCSIPILGPKHSEWTPFRRFWATLGGLFLGLGCLFFGICDSSISEKRISKLFIWGLVLLLYTFFKVKYIGWI